MLNVWLENALAVSGLSQAELARLLSEALSRAVDKTAVTRMVSGERKISGDELIEIARICLMPVPFSLRTDPLAESIPFAEELFPVSPDTVLQMTAAGLQKEIRNGYLRCFSQMEPAIAESVASHIMEQIFRSRNFQMLVDAKEGEEKLFERAASLRNAKIAGEGALRFMDRKIKG